MEKGIELTKSRNSLGGYDPISKAYALGPESSRKLFENSCKVADNKFPDNPCEANKMIRKCSQQSGFIFNKREISQLKREGYGEI